MDKQHISPHFFLPFFNHASLFILSVFPQFTEFRIFGQDTPFYQSIHLGRIICFHYWITNDSVPCVSLSRSPFHAPRFFRRRAVTQSSITRPWMLGMRSCREGANQLPAWLTDWLLLTFSCFCLLRLFGLCFLHIVSFVRSTLVLRSLFFFTLSPSLPLCYFLFPFHSFSFFFLLLFLSPSPNAPSSS